MQRIGGQMNTTHIVEPTQCQPIIETITLEELMASNERVEWRINGFLPQGSIAFVTGITGVKRSFFLQQLALALTTGEDFLDYTIPEMCRVLMYEAELTKGQLKRRAERMLTIYPTTQDLVFNNRYSLMLDRNDGCGLLIHTMQEKGIDVAILDPLYMLHTGSVSSEQDMMRILAPLETYCLEQGKNIIIAAHSTKIPEFEYRTIRRSNRRASGGAVKGSSSQVQIGAYVWSLSDSLLTSDRGQLIFEKNQGYAIARPIIIEV
jgi:RecA-family ATPase